MKKLLSIISVFALSLYYVGIARAESSADVYEPKNRAYQVFIDAQSNDTVVIPRDTVVIVDNQTALTSGQSGTMGAYIRTANSTDSIFVIGVTDEQVSPGTMGKVCIRGPHKVVMVNNMINQSTGAILSTSTSGGLAGVYSRADGTAGGYLGILLSTTATSETGDASNTFWGYINPQYHK